jgi:hypothetical protein
MGRLLLDSFGLLVIAVNLHAQLGSAVRGGRKDRLVNVVLLG